MSEDNDIFKQKTVDIPYVEMKLYEILEHLNAITENVVNMNGVYEDAVKQFSENPMKFGIQIADIGIRIQHLLTSLSLLREVKIQEYFDELHNDKFAFLDQDQPNGENPDKPETIKLTLGDTV